MDAYAIGRQVKRPRGSTSSDVLFNKRPVAPTRFQSRLDARVREEVRNEIASEFADAALRQRRTAYVRGAKDGALDLSARYAASRAQNVKRAVTAGKVVGALGAAGLVVGLGKAAKRIWDKTKATNAAAASIVAKNSEEMARRKLVAKKRKRKTAVKGRRVGRIRGRGGYWGDVGALSGAAVGAGTGMLAGGVGGVAGAGLGYQIGGTAGNLIDYVNGSGDYSIRQNSIMSGSKVYEGVPVPSFGNMSHATVIRHREYIGDLLSTGATAFTNTSYPINPGLASTFPWLSSVASAYDQYQVLGMLFEFRSTSSDYAATSALGQVIMATEYDAADSTFTTKQQMENSQYAVSSKPSISQVHAIECDPAVTFSPIKYIRNGPVASGKDQRLYDHGLFQIATNGLVSSGSTALGELWVTYEIALYKPSLNAIGSFTDHFTLPSTVTSSHYLSADTTTVNTPNVGSTLGGTTVNSTYTFPATARIGAYYLIQYQMTGAVSTITTQLALGSLVGCSAVSLLSGTGAQAVVAPYSGALGCATTMITEIVQKTAVVASFNIASGTLPGTLVGGDLWIQQYPSALIS